MHKEVNFEVAQLLKEKGFDNPTRSIYQYEQLVIDSNYEKGYKNSFNSHDWYEISAPTIAEVVMWLYEKHKIWISVDMTFEENGETFWFSIRQCKPDDRVIESFNEYSTPTEAALKAIEHVLKELI
jgi:hypothetical protein